MSAYKLRITVLLPDKAAPFVTLVNKVVAAKGSTDAAAEVLGVSRIVVRNLLDRSYLTDKQARLIFAAYKNIKHTL